MDLQIPIKDLKDRVFKIYARRLEKLGIQNLEDFLYHVPSRYDDYSILSTISSAQPGETVTIKGEILKIENVYARSYRKIQKAQVEDGTGQIDVVWFNQPFILKSLGKGDRVSLAGRVDVSKGKKVLISPDYELR